ncbi:MAG: L,D-transpeptidase family protein [Gemmatimonadaceae bacterium]|nr:L,D-transpeptidase family protein [Gemmatimonadaceae bacterium]
MVVGVALVGPVAHGQVRPDTVASTLLLGTHPWLTGGGRFADVQRVVRDARAADSTAALRWTTSAGTATPAARTALTHLLNDPETSRADRTDADILDGIAKRFETSHAAPPERGLFDVGVDVVVARHAFMHRQGHVDPTRVHAEWSLGAADLDYATLRTAIATGGGADESFAALEPRTRSYELLVTGLLDARREAADSLDHLPMAPARALNVGARYPDAQALANVLVRLGELPRRFPVATVHHTYSKPLFDAVARWQNRKLKKGRATGTLTAPVLARLLDEYRSREDRLAMAIERWRWLPRNFSNDPLVVNLPEYRLHTYSRFQGDSVDRLSMNVVIGRADSNATPVFAANMTQVVFSPQWHVPKSIMLKEILPAASSDTGYLTKHNYELTTGAGKLLPNTSRNIARIGTGVMVRQRSGDDNSLGKVKFLLPNPYDIYLHDTPSRSLFSRVRRDFSHGCVRLGNPMAMARYVLGSQPVWTDSKITEAMNSGVETFVRVPRPIPVLIVYQTAVAEPDGSVRYFNDVYGHDRTLTGALEKAR